LKTAPQAERRELLSLLTSEVAKERWRSTSQDERVEFMRQVAAVGKDAKPKPRFHAAL
jgi:hypothetical protein